MRRAGVSDGRRPELDQVHQGRVQQLRHEAQEPERPGRVENSGTVGDDALQVGYSDRRECWLLIKSEEKKKNMSSVYNVIKKFNLWFLFKY